MTASAGDAVALYIDAESSQSLGIAGQTILVGNSISSPDVLTVIYEYAGAPPIETMTSGIGIVDLPGIQVVCRAGAEDYDVARNLAVAIREMLGSMPEGTYSGVKIMHIQALGQVFTLGADDNNRPLLACNYSVWVER
jgi:hypothetical protein